MILLLFLAQLLNAQSDTSIVIRFSRQPKVVLDTVSSGAKMFKASIWQATACNWTAQPATLSSEMIAFLAASKISVTDLAITQAVIDHAKLGSIRYRYTDTSTKLLDVGTLLVPSLQAGGIIGGSPWISGGIIAANLVMKILIKQKDEMMLSQLPGRWSGSAELRSRECGTWLFLGEYTPTMSKFEVSLNTTPVIAETRFTRPPWAKD